MIYVYLIGYFIAAPIITMMMFNNLQGSYSGNWKHKFYREDLGMSIAIAMLGSIIWPITLFLIYCMTGFAKHGIFRQK